MTESSPLRETGAGFGTPAERLARIAALLSDPARITPALLRVKIRAVCENREVPAERKPFVALAERAGVPQAVRYRAWSEFRGISVPNLVEIAASDEADEASMAKSATVLYRYYDEQDNLLYVGITDLLSGRVLGHIGRSSWMEFAVRSTIARYPTRTLAAEAETRAIETEHPLFNLQHNGSPEAQRRLVEYLVAHDRLDLLAPAISRG